MFMWLFYISCFLIIYNYFLYPIILFSVSLFFREKRSPETNPIPFITMLVSVYNEEQVIAEKINNFLTISWPSDKIELVIGDDGSDDRTAEIIKKYADSMKIRYFHFSGRNGKAWVLNKLVKETKGDFLVFSDANTFYHKNALYALVKKMGDEHTGGVCGRLVLTHEDNAEDQSGELSYWLYESWLKKLEGRVKTVLGANGAIYAVRRDLFINLPTETFLNDDFIIPMLIIKQGYRFAYAEDALAYENAPKDIREEFVRKVRIGAGNFNALPIILPLLSPRYGFIAFSLLSHKIIRWCVPLLLILIFISNFFLLDMPVFRIAIILQILFYLIAFLSCRNSKINNAFKIFRFTTYFILTNIALLFGLFRSILGSQPGAWKKAKRK